MASVHNKRNDLSIKEKLSTLERYDKLPKFSQCNAAVQLKISQPLLCKLLKNRDFLMMTAAENKNLECKRNRGDKDGQVASALSLWFTNVREQDARVEGPLVRQKAEELAKKMVKYDFVATEGWFHRWKKRENIVYKRTHGEQKDADVASADRWIEEGPTFNVLGASAQGLPSGFLQGSSYALGNFEQCVHRVQSKYCLADIKVQVPHNGSVWELLQEPQSPLQIRRNIIHWGFCVPISCRGQDLQWAVQGLLEGSGVVVQVPEDSCQIKDQEHSHEGLRFIFRMMLVLYAIFITSCSWSEYCNNEKTNKQNLNKQNGSFIQKAFSVQHNWKLLIKCDKDASCNISCIHGLKFILMLIIIIGHRGEALMSAPLLNREDLQLMFFNSADIVIMNSHMIVDIFFVMSGFLVTWNMLRLAAMGYKISLLATYVYRYVRLTITYSVIIVFHALFLFELDTGPLWKSRIGTERDNCMRNWWTNLLYINNYVNPSRPCVDQAWYLACDMQLYLIAPFLSAAMQSQRAVFVFSTTMALSVIVPATITYIKELDPTIIPYPETLGHTAQLQTYTWAYIPAYVRAGPYFVGVASASWLHKLKSEGSHISKGLRYAGWVLAPLMSLVVTMMSLIFYHQNIGKLWSAVYAGTHRILFSLPVAFGITASALGDTGPLYQLFSWKVFQPLSRLTYCMFLCHGAIQLYHIGSLQHPQFLTTYNVCWSAMADVVISLLVALILFLAIESPSQILLNHYIQRFLPMTTHQETVHTEHYENEVESHKSFLDLCSSHMKALLSPQYASKQGKQKSYKNK